MAEGNEKGEIEKKRIFLLKYITYTTSICLCLAMHERIK